MRKIFAIVVSLILLFSLSVPAFAAATRAFLLQEYDVGSDAVFCYGKQLPANGHLEVSAGSRIIEDTSLSTLKQEQIPVTVYCLADCATSMSDKMIQQRNDVLLTLSSLMADEDSMVLATIDATLTESQPMNTKSARDTAIDTIAGQVWYTNLYDGIGSAMKTLHTSNIYNTNRCLVILSDGHDDKSTASTTDTIQKQVQEAGIPVYTVILGNTVTEKELTQQRKFVEESLGGFLAFPDQDGVSAASAAQQIWHSIKDASMIRIGLEELQADDADQQLLIRYDSADTRYEDTILIRAVDLPAPVVNADEITEETGLPTTEATEPPMGPEEGLPAEFLIACGIGVILLGAGVAAFFLLRKKPASAVSDNPWPVDPPEDPPEDPVSDLISGFKFSDDPSIVNAGCGVTIPVEGRCHVNVVAIMHPDIATDFHLTRNTEITFGRSEKADIILNETDMKLSSLHGCLFWNGEMLLVQDRNSTNGTAVNGEICPRNVWLRLDDGAVLTAGNFEYRVNFKEET